MGKNIKDKLKGKIKRKLHDILAEKRNPKTYTKKNNNQYISIGKLPIIKKVGLKYNRPASLPKFTRKKSSALYKKHKSAPQYTSTNLSNYMGSVSPLLSEASSSNSSTRTQNSPATFTSSLDTLLSTNSSASSLKSSTTYTPPPRSPPPPPYPFPSTHYSGLNQKMLLETRALHAKKPVSSDSWVSEYASKPERLNLMNDITESDNVMMQNNTPNLGVDINTHYGHFTKLSSLTNKEKKGLLILGNAGKPGDSCIDNNTKQLKSLSEEFPTFEGDVVSNLLLTIEYNDTYLKSQHFQYPPVLSQGQRYDKQLEIYKYLFSDSWGLKNQSNTDTIQGVDYTIASIDEYADAWYISKPITLSVKQNKKYDYNNQFKIILSFVPMPNVSIGSHDYSMRNTSNSNLYVRSELYNESLKNAIFTGLVALANLNCHEILIPDLDSDYTNSNHDIALDPLVYENIIRDALQKTVSSPDGNKVSLSSYFKSIYILKKNQRALGKKKKKKTKKKKTKKTKKTKKKEK